jgi:hypothetical protein
MREIFSLFSLSFRGSSPPWINPVKHIMMGTADHVMARKQKRGRGGPRSHYSLQGNSPNDLRTSSLKGPNTSQEHYPKDQAFNSMGLRRTLQIQMMVERFCLLMEIEWNGTLAKQWWRTELLYK